MTGGGPKRILLWPGLGADQRMFQPLKELLPLCQPLPLPAPHPAETMPDFALRVARQAEVTADDLIGGCSFGSIVASAMARRFPVRGLLLLAGATSGASVRVVKHPALRWLWRFALSPMGVRLFAHK
jgi:pimeloyl-ACP methyl ester carboxylesterase